MRNLCPLSQIMDGDEGGHAIKYIDALLGPDPECDPYPRQPYKKKVDLFEAKYADDFYKEYPSLKDVPFATLLTKHADNPIIQRVSREFPVINKAYKASVAEWRAKWPTFAEKVDSTRGRLTVQRKERKYKNKQDPPNGEEGREEEEGRPKPTKRPRASLGTEGGVATREFLNTKMDFLKLMYEQQSVGVAGLNWMRDYIENEHAKRMRELDYERQYIN